MRKTLIIAAVVLLAYGLSLPLRARTATVQDQLTGDWSAKVRDTDKGKKLWLEMRSNREVGRGWFNTSSDYNLEDFSGFNPNANGNTQFALNREAGNIVFTGLVSDGKGVGDFRYTVNPAFVTAMRNLGYDDELKTERLFSMALHDVSARFVQETKTMGFEKLSIDKQAAAQGEALLRLKRAELDAELQRLHTQYKEAHPAIQEKLAQLEALNRMVEDAVNSRIQSDVQARLLLPLAELEARLKTLQRSYTEKHPNVQAVKAQIEALKKELEHLHK